MIGTRLGAYQILEEVGRGGMAVVYRAYQPSVDRHVALKVIQRMMSGDESDTERFQREARLIARLEHAHILPVYDFDGRHDPPYIVMRYLEGGTLKDVLKQGQLPVEEVVYLLRQIGGALDYAHRQGIIHRDIKPSNIMIDREGNAYITDFGIARMIVQQKRRVNTDDRALTITGAIIGTADYMSPEQAKGAPDFDQRVDVYALGVMAFQMLAGRLPFESDSPIETIFKHMHEPVPRLSDLQPALSSELDDVMRQALAKNPEDRYATVPELIEAISAILGTGVVQPVTIIAAADCHHQKTVEQRAVTNQIVLNPDETPRIASHQISTDSGSVMTEHTKNLTVTYVNATEYNQFLHETQGSEKARAALAQFWLQTISLIDTHNGKIFSKNENTLLALWGVEMAREDDPESAVRAALLMQNLIRSQVKETEDEPLPIKIGVSTESVLLTPAPGQHTYVVSGSAINLAQRLSEQAFGGVVIAHDTYRAVQGVFDISLDAPLKVRGRRDLLQTYRVQAVRPRAFRPETRGVQGVETAMVGRLTELEHLQNVFVDAVEEKETQVATILGEAGLGKSRLLWEFEKWVDLRPELARLFRGRATSGMLTMPYALLRDVISFRFEIQHNDPPEILQKKLEDGVQGLTGAANPEMAHMIGHLVGFGLHDSPYIRGLTSDPHQLSNRARQWFKRLFIQTCQIDPIMIELEDIHYADDASLDLLMELASENPNLPLLLVCLARPALRDRRPTWGSGQSFHSQIKLKPLDRRNSRDLVREILQKVPEVPRNLRDAIVDHAEGNPFFIEEVIKMLIEDRVIRVESEQWSVDESKAENLRVPPTLIGLLQARFDTLLYPEKLLMQRASVIGRIFYDSALTALDAADDVHIANIPEVLETLVKNGFIHQRETTAFAGHTEYIFSQSMMRDLVYENLLLRHLNVYHAAAAEWLISVVGDRHQEYVPIIARHFERGSQLTKAAEYLTLAGDHTMRISAFREAQSYYDRALALIPADDPRTPIIQVRLGDAHQNLGDYTTADFVLAEALTSATTQNNIPLMAQSLYLLSQIATSRGNYQTAQDILNDTLPLARTDAAGLSILAKILYGLGDVEWRLGNAEAAKEHLEESMQHARKIADPATVLYALNRLGAVNAWLLNDLEKAEALWQECFTLAQHLGNLERKAAASNNLGEIARSRRDYAAARQRYEEAVRIGREINHIEISIISLSNLGEMALHLNDLPTAKTSLHEALELAHRRSIIPGVLTALQVIARLNYLSGEKSKALGLLGLTIFHPATSSDHQRVADELLKDFGLTRESAAAELEQGKSLPLDQVVQEFLREKSTASIS